MTLHVLGSFVKLRKQNLGGGGLQNITNKKKGKGTPLRFSLKHCLRKQFWGGGLRNPEILAYVI